MRSTTCGRLSSSQDFSIGRSISLTRSSSVRAFWANTVCASELKAESRPPPAGNQRRSLSRSLVRSRRRLWRPRRRLVSPRARRRRFARCRFGSRRTFGKLDVRTGIDRPERARARRHGHRFRQFKNLRFRILGFSDGSDDLVVEPRQHGVDIILIVLGRRGCRNRLRFGRRRYRRRTPCRFRKERSPISASSSAMILRIEARISSIEGSCALAGCVISDSTFS